MIEMSEYMTDIGKVSRVMKTDAFVRKGVASGKHLSLIQIQTRFENAHNEWIDPRYLQKILRELVGCGCVEKHGQHTYQYIYRSSAASSTTTGG